MRLTTVRPCPKLNIANTAACQQAASEGESQHSCWRLSLGAALKRESGTPRVQPSSPQTSTSPPPPPGEWHAPCGRRAAGIHLRAPWRPPIHRGPTAPPFRAHGPPLTAFPGGEPPRRPGVLLDCGTHQACHQPCCSLRPTLARLAHPAALHHHDHCEQQAPSPRAPHALMACQCSSLHPASACGHAPWALRLAGASSTPRLRPPWCKRCCDRRGAKQLAHCCTSHHTHSLV